MKTENLLTIVGHFCFGIIFGIGIMGSIAIYTYPKYDRDEVITTLFNYYDATEAFLDEIEETEDIMSGSDVNCEYLNCRNAVEVLLQENL